MMALKLKYLIFLLLFLNFAGIGWATNYCNDAACQACFLFTEGSGTTVADSSQNTNTGNFLASGQPPWAAMSGTNAPSYAPYSVTYAGGNDTIDIGFDASIQLQTNSIVVWLKDWAGSNFYNIDYYITSCGYEWIIDGTNIGYAYYDGAVRGWYKYAHGGLSANTWYHIGGVWNKTAGNVTMYVNGVAGNPINTTTGNIVYVGNDGGHLGGGGQYAFSSGSLSETGFFNDVLTPTEINDIMDNGLAGAAPSVAAPMPQVIMPRMY